jgi:hypothetical protein
LLAGFVVVNLGWQWTNMLVLPLLLLMSWVALRKEVAGEQHMADRAQAMVR